MSTYLRRGVAIGMLLALATVAQGQADFDPGQFAREWPSVCRSAVTQLNQLLNDKSLGSIAAQSPLSEAAICECTTARIRDDRYLKHLFDVDANKVRTLMQNRGFPSYFVGKFSSYLYACVAVELERSADSLMPPTEPPKTTTRPAPTAPAEPQVPAAPSPPAPQPHTGAALDHALSWADLQRAPVLPEAGANAKVKDSSDQVPLHWTAAELKQVVDRPIAQGADVNATDASGFAPLHGATYYSRKDVVERLLREGAAVNVRSATGATPLHKSMERLGNPQVTPVASPSDVAAMVDVVELLLANGADVKARDNYDTTPLHLAAATGQPTLIEMLIAKGADINARNKVGVTPLYLAAKLDRAGAAEALIARGAEVDARTASGNTALIVAAGEGHPGPAEALVAHGADVDAKDHTGKTPLVWALSVAAFVSPSGQRIASSVSAARSAAERQKFLEFVEIAKSEKGQWREVAMLLIKHQAQTNPGPNVDQPLFLAALMGDAELVTELIEHGADINDAKGGETALHCAIAERHKEAATVLINKGANLNARSIRRGLTPLHFLAGTFDDSELAELMIQRGADVNARDKQGITPLTYALAVKNNRVADVLKRNGGR